MKIEATFEETLVHYPFAPLVLMAISLVKWGQQSKTGSGADSDGAMQAPVGAAS